MTQNQTQKQSRMIKEAASALYGKEAMNQTPVQLNSETLHELHRLGIVNGPAHEWAKKSLMDLRKTRLAQLVTAPNTSDRDRYARALRAEVRPLQVLADTEGLDRQVAAVYEMALNSLLRGITAKDDVAVNRRRAAVALDAVAALLPGMEWRTPYMWVDHDDDFYQRPAEMLAYDADELTECTCVTYPRDLCFAAIHEIV